MNESTRRHETSIEIPAPVEQVWEAITTASGVEKWFAPEVRVDPRLGGKYFVSWGPGVDGAGRIEIFEPGLHFRVVTERRRSNECYGTRTEPAAAPVRIAVDYYLESREGKTFLRLVNSGFLNTSDWDSEYEGTKLGWPVYLDVLRHAVVRHPRARCRQFFLPAAASMPVEQAWANLMGPGGLRSANPIDTQPAGSRYRWELAGQPVEGALERWWAPRMFTATWERMNDAFLWLSCKEMQGLAAIGLQVYLLRHSGEEFERVKSNWEALLARLFPRAASA